MFKVDNLRELLDYIVKVAKTDYPYGFYNMIACENGGYMANPLYIKYDTVTTEFYGGEVPFNQMATAWEYKDIYFRACECVTKEGSTIAFALHKNELFDECWCIDIPLYIYNLCYEVSHIEY